MAEEQTKRLEELAPKDEFAAILREATRSVEDDLALEDAGWISLGAQAASPIDGAERVTNLKLSRLYYTKDPLAKQSIRLWTDYTFGRGLRWSVEDKHEATRKVLEAFWNAPTNQALLSARGQRLSSDKALVDGEIFFAIFLGAKGDAPKLRRIDPLEITEIISNPEDVEEVLYYRRDWTDAQGSSHTDYLRSTTNIKGESAKNAAGKEIQTTEGALVYHLALNTISQRGNPLLTPALDWIRQYRRFLASRIAIMLALTRFAWRTKVKGGQAAVDIIKAQTEGKEINAGSTVLENLGSDTTPIKTDSGAKNAYDDGRMIKLQVAAAVGFAEQYFGDISTGNLATAKTVELPILKMIQSYQDVWGDTYKAINEVVLAHAGIPPDKWYVDMAFPPIAPADVALIATALATILQALPELSASEDVKVIAMQTLGVNDPAEALKVLSEAVKANPGIELASAVKRFRESLKGC